jgi:hypothetical protein
MMGVVVALGFVYVLTRRHRISNIEFFIVGSILVWMLLSVAVPEGYADDVSTDNPDFVSKIISIPKQVRDTITPALDRLIASVHDSPKGGVMSKIDFPEIKSDEDYAKLVADFKAVDDLLKGMQNYDSDSYDKIIRSIQK